MRCLVDWSAGVLTRSSYGFQPAAAEGSSARMLRFEIVLKQRLQLGQDFGR